MAKKTLPKAKAFEKSKMDKAVDKATGLKEGSKGDMAIDKAVMKATGFGKAKSSKAKGKK